MLEALLGVKSEFVRTPKYRVEETTDATWKRKKYKRKRGLLPLLELCFALYFLLAIAYSARLAHVGNDPVSAAVLFWLWIYGRDEFVADCEWEANIGVCGGQLKLRQD